MKKLILVLVVSTASSCSDDDNNGQVSPPQDPIAWGQLSGIWQTYNYGASEKYHNSWIYIKDQGDVLAFYDCRTPTWEQYKKTRENNTYALNDMGVHAEIISEEEIRIIDNMTTFPEIAYAYSKVEQKDLFSMGTFSINVVDNDTGRHWSVGTTSTFCVEIRDYRDINLGWGLEILADNVRVEMNLIQDDFSGNYIPNENLHMRIEGDWISVLASEGNVNCEYTLDEDLYCGFNVSGLGKTATGEFVIQKEYLIARNSVISAGP